MSEKKENKTRTGITESADNQRNTLVVLRQDKTRQARTRIFYTIKSSEVYLTTKEIL